MINSCINPYYLNKETLHAVKKRLNKEGIVLLENFLREESFVRLKNPEGRFNRVYRPLYHKISVAVYCNPVMQLAINIITQFVKQITGEEYHQGSVKLFQARVGDYTLLNDHQKSRQGFSLIFDMTSFWNPKWGGQMVVQIKKSGETIILRPQENALLLLKTKKVRIFLKRINHRAKGRRLFLGQFTIQQNSRHLDTLL